MNKLTPDLYAEAFGILTRKLLKDDCLAMRNSILAKRPEKELITELFQPLLEMMKASESLTPNLSNPLYTQLTPPDEGNVPTFFIRDFFYIYYDIMEHGVSFDDICRHFEDDHGAKWTASILHLEETPSDPVSYVLKSSLDAPEKLAMLQILLDGKTWIEECLLLLKQIAAAIEPILNKYHSLYTYCDTLVSSKDCQKILLRRIETTLPQDTCILPCLSFCNMADFYISFAAKTQCSNILRLGILFCAIDFFLPEDFTPDQISEHLKMFSDPTKLAILSILKKEPTYQSDLAKRLSLTTATISHHMNQLYLNGFVCHEVRNNKLYYFYQSDMVEHTVNQLFQYLDS